MLYIGLQGDSAGGVNDLSRRHFSELLFPNVLWNMVYSGKTLKMNRFLGGLSFFPNTGWVYRSVAVENADFFQGTLDPTKNKPIVKCEWHCGIAAYFQWFIHM